MSDDDFLFHELDDPAPPAPSADMLEHAVSRGRSIRRRRQSLSVLAAASVLAVAGGVAAVVSAQDSASGQRDNLTVPADSGTPSVSASVASGRHHPHRSGVLSYGSGGHSATVRHHQPAGGTTCVIASPPAQPPASEEPTASPTDTPVVADSPTTDATVAPAPSATSAPDVCASPSASPAPTETPSAQPADVPTATASAG